MIKGLKGIIQQLRETSEFMKNVTTLLSGTVLAMFVAYLAQPILARLYTPEAFGLFDSFVAIVGIMIPISTMRYEDAVMLPEEDDEALGVLGLTIVLAGLVCLLCAVLFIFQTQLIAWFGQPELIKVLIWLAPTLFIVRLAKLSQRWLNRKSAFKTNSVGYVLETSTTAGSRIGLSFITPATKPLGLIGGYVLGHMVSAGWYFYHIVKDQQHFWKGLFNQKAIIKAASRYKRFPSFTMPAALLATLNSRLPVLLLLFFFTESTVGYYGRAFALFAVPLSLIGNSVAQVFFTEGTQAYRENRLDQFTTKVHSRLVTFALFPAAAAIIAGPQLMSFILGAQWEIAGVYLQWLAPWYFLASVASPLTHLFDIKEQQKLDLTTSLFFFPLHMGIFLYGCMQGDALTALIYLSIGGVIVRIVHIIVLLKVAGVSLFAGLKTYLSHSLIAAPFALALWAVSTLNLPWLTTLSLAITGLGYLFVVYRKVMG